MQETKLKNNKYVIGGIGDFIQVLDSARKEEKIWVFSHYKDAKNFFLNCGIDIEFVYFEEMNNDFLEIIKKENLVPLERNLFLMERIGIHPIGSKFSNKFWHQRGQPIKLLPASFVKKLIEDDKFYYIFCSQDEVEEYKDLISKNVMIISFPNIWDSLKYVEYCNKVIAVDSSIKSYSCARKIPTLVFLGDYEDKFRDENFINPYVEEGVMKVIRFKTLEDSMIEEVKQWISQ